MRRPYLILVDRPGLYQTRGGRQVRIDRINCTGASFPCHGHVIKHDKLGRTRRRWSIWALSGAHRITEGSTLDLVARISD